MPEIESYVFNHKELVAAMIKSQNIHEGIWELALEFSLAAHNIQMLPPGTNPASADQLLFPVSPGAIVAVTKVGIRKVAKDSPLSVDASQVNPE